MIDTDRVIINKPGVVYLKLIKLFLKTRLTITQLSYINKNLYFNNMTNTLILHDIFQVLIDRLGKETIGYLQLISTFECFYLYKNNFSSLNKAKPLFLKNINKLLNELNGWYSHLSFAELALCAIALKNLNIYYLPLIIALSRHSHNKTDLTKGHGLSLNYKFLAFNVTIDLTYELMLVLRENYEFEELLNFKYSSYLVSLLQKTKHHSNDKIVNSHFHEEINITASENELINLSVKQQLKHYSKEFDKVAFPSKDNIVLFNNILFKFLKNLNYSLTTTIKSADKHLS